MENYIKINQIAYDTLADEYYENYTRYDRPYRAVGEHLVAFMLPELKKIMPNKKYRILELGCGTGSILSALGEEKNCDVFAIDISKNMLSYANKSNPNAKLLQGNALDMYGKECEHFFSEEFDLIVMAAFIHLFPVDDAKLLLSMIHSWLVDRGLIYIDTTKEPSMLDGRISVKCGYRTEVRRLRTRWTAEEFNNMLSDRFSIIKQVPFVSLCGKTWLRTVAQKKDALL